MCVVIVEDPPSLPTQKTPQTTTPLVWWFEENTELASPTMQAPIVHTEHVRPNTSAWCNANGSNGCWTVSSYSELKQQQKQKIGKFSIFRVMSYVAHAAWISELRWRSALVECVVCFGTSWLWRIPVYCCSSGEHQHLAINPKWEIHWGLEVNDLSSQSSHFNLQRWLFWQIRSRWCFTRHLSLPWRKAADVSVEIRYQRTWPNCGVTSHQFCQRFAVRVLNL